MAAISRGGLDSTYRLQRGVNLQPGSIRQPLRTLEEAGVIARSEAPARRRNRRGLSLTAAGEHFLDECWTQCLEPKQDVESILRGVTVALLFSAPEMAFRFLMQAAEVREQSYGVPELAHAPPPKSPIDFHAAMRAVHADRRRAMEANLFKEFAETLIRSSESTT